MGWSDPVVGGVDLRRAAIRSPNYAAGSAGWTVNQDGSAEFNNLTIRGTFNGTNFVINTSGAFFYSGTPALGNLICSISTAAGTDAQGNGYVSGVGTYDNTLQLFAQLAGAGLELGVIANHFPDTTDAGFIASTINGVTQTIGMGSPVNVSLTDPGFLVLRSGDINATTGSVSCPYLQLFDGDGLSDLDAFISGTLIKTDTAGNHATWQDPSLLLGAGWAIGPSSGTVQHLQYRKDPLDNLVLAGAVHTTSTTPAATLFTLPSGPPSYRPAITQRVVAVSNSGGTPTSRFIEINSNGGVLVMNNLTTSGTDVYIYATVPLGHIP